MDFPPIAAHVVVRPVEVALDVRVVVASQWDYVRDPPQFLEQVPPGRARGGEVLLAAHGAVDGGGAVAVYRDRVADLDRHAHRGAGGRLPGPRGLRRGHVGGLWRGHGGGQRRGERRGHRRGSSGGVGGGGVGRQGRGHQRGHWGGNGSRHQSWQGGWRRSWHGSGRRCGHRRGI